MEPNLHKQNPKLHKFQFCARNWWIIFIYSEIYGVCEFKYATWIFQGAKGVAMVTKFRYN